MQPAKVSICLYNINIRPSTIIITRAYRWNYSLFKMEGLVRLFECWALFECSPSLESSGGARGVKWEHTHRSVGLGGVSAHFLQSFKTAFKAEI